MSKIESLSPACRHARLRLRLAVVALAWGALPGAAWPADPTGAPVIEQAGWAEGDTVRDLLRADAQAAQAARHPQQAADWLGPPHAGSPRPSLQAGQADQVDVLAIYGVGKSLHAEVSVNGRVARYRAGRAWPLESQLSADAERYALLSIDTPCVRLRKAGAPLTACLLNQDAIHD
ncbi:hypothetical protein [Bordetella petrii]|uniref:hypothetical protein n=1 Tax=Bordetella petrii TaxID=94624 RepID=UPI001E347E8F|nr:hypothetical protein [Bordetella petrii]